MSRTRIAIAAMFAVTLSWAGSGFAQDAKPKDDALDRLLEKLEGKPASKDDTAAEAEGRQTKDRRFEKG